MSEKQLGTGNSHPTLALDSDLKENNPTKKQMLTIISECFVAKLLTDVEKQDAENVLEVVGVLSAQMGLAEDDILRSV